MRTVSNRPFLSESEVQTKVHGMNFIYSVYYALNRQGAVSANELFTLRSLRRSFAFEIHKEA